MNTNSFRSPIYILNLFIKSINAFNALKKQSRICIDLIKLQKQGVVKEPNIKFTNNIVTCDVCDKANIHKLPFKNTAKRAKECLEIIYLDICGPFKVQSSGKPKYYATLIDNKTWLTQVAMLKSRDEVLDAFKKYKLRVKKEVGRKVIEIRSDNAKEYVLRDFTKCCFWKRSTKTVIKSREVRINEIYRQLGRKNLKGLTYAAF